MLILNYWMFLMIITKFITNLVYNQLYFITKQNKSGDFHVDTPDRTRTELHRPYSS